MFMADRQPPEGLPVQPAAQAKASDPKRLRSQAPPRPTFFENNFKKRGNRRPDRDVDMAEQRLSPPSASA